MGRRSGRGRGRDRARVWEGGINNIESQDNAGSPLEYKYNANK